MVNLTRYEFLTFFDHFQDVADRPDMTPDEEIQEFNSKTLRPLFWTVLKEDQVDYEVPAGGHNWGYVQGVGVRIFGAHKTQYGLNYGHVLGISVEVERGGEGPHRVNTHTFKVTLPRGEPDKAEYTKLLKKVAKKVKARVEKVVAAKAASDKAYRQLEIQRQKEQGWKKAFEARFEAAGFPGSVTVDSDGALLDVQFRSNADALLQTLEGAKFS